MWKWVLRCTPDGPAFSTLSSSDLTLRCPPFPTLGSDGPWHSPCCVHSASSYIRERACECDRTSTQPPRLPCVQASIIVTSWWVSPLPRPHLQPCSQHSDESDLLKQKSDHVTPLLRIVRALTAAGSSAGAYLTELPQVASAPHPLPFAFAPATLASQLLPSTQTPSLGVRALAFPFVGKSFPPPRTHGLFPVFLQGFSQMSPPVASPPLGCPAWSGDPPTLLAPSLLILNPFFWSLSNIIYALLFNLITSFH